MSTEADELMIWLASGVGPIGAVVSLLAAWVVFGFCLRWVRKLGRALRWS